MLLGNLRLQFVLLLGGVGIHYHIGGTWVMFLKSWLCRPIFFLTSDVCRVSEAAWFDMDKTLWNKYMHMVHISGKCA